MIKVKVPRKCILKQNFAYAIIVIGKTRVQVHVDEEQNPRTVVQHSPGILLFFLQVAKHPPGYQLSL